MQQCYDWQSNVLKFTDVNGNKYNLKFRGNKTIVHGDSATGKSLLCTMLKSYINDNNNASFKPYNADNIFIVSKDNKDKLSLQKGKLIIIDRAELILDEQMVEIINADRGDNREDDEHDIYIVRGDIFKKTYGNRVVTELFRDVVQEGWGTAVGI